jgi:CHAT domain-containing protein
MPARSACFAYVLRRNRPMVWVPLWETRSAEEYATLVAGYGRVFGSLQRAASWRRRVEPDTRVRQELRAWGALYVQPLLPHLGGVEHLVLDTPLQPVELAGLADGRALGEVFDVSYVPSALVLELLGERAQSRAARSGQVLAVSGPAEPTAQSVASLVNLKETERSHRQLRSAYRRDGTPLEALPRLRYSALEARAVAARFDRSTVLVDQGSGERSLDLLARSRGLRAFGVVHVAAHTLTDAAPEACALALADRTRTGGSSDGLLEVGDILLEWELDADLLTLSGCETFRAAGAGRGEPYGFVSALFGSGARRILSSVWTVDDRATAILMDRFYENLTGQYRGGRMGYRAAPMPPARALREAKRHVSALRDASGRRPFEHPAYWGGFVLSGLP